jgi:hypothetical protein
MEMSSPRTPSTLEGGAPFEPGSNIDAQRQGSVPQLAGVQTTPVQDTSRLPPASMAEAEAFLNDVMPTEFVPSTLVCALDSLASFCLRMSEPMMYDF